MQMQVGLGLKMVAKREFDLKVARIASMLRSNAKTLIVVNGKIEGVAVDKIVAAIEPGVEHRITENRLYLVRK